MNSVCPLELLQHKYACAKIILLASSLSAVLLCCFLFTVVGFKHNGSNDLFDNDTLYS